MEQGITIFHKDEAVKKEEVVAPRKPKRGPLNVDEQVTLIIICKIRANYTEITTYPRNFWIGIEVALEMQIGRRYSHYSCRRRITDYLAQRTRYRDALKRGLPPPYQDFDDRVAIALDHWMDSNDRERKQRESLGLLNNDTEVSQSSKLLRVADWVERLPDPDPQGILSIPPLDQSETSSRKAALWARIQAARTSAQGSRETQPLKNEPASLANRKPLPPQTERLLPSTPQQPHTTLAGTKRPRDEDEAGPGRAAPRPRTDLPNLASSTPALKESPDNSQPLVLRENLPVFQTSIDTVFGRFWDSMLPHFKERESRDGLSIAKSESIMHDLFNEVGSALARAFIKLEHAKSS